MPLCLRYASAAKRNEIFLAEARSAVREGKSLVNFLMTDWQSESIEEFELVRWRIDKAVSSASSSMLNADLVSSNEPCDMCMVKMGRFIQFGDLLIMTSPAVPVKVGELCVMCAHLVPASDHDP